MKYIYSVPELLSAYYKNKDMINAYVAHKSNEGYDEENVSILGFSIGFFITLLVVFLMLWGITIYMIYKNWNRMSGICKFFAILFLILPHGGPIVSLIIVMLCISSTTEVGTPLKSSFHGYDRY
jgi:hypothetical protein